MHTGSNDELGRRTQRIDEMSSVLTTNVFGYNDRSEVIATALGIKDYNYNYDSIGNRVSSSNNAASLSEYISNELNPYTSVTSATLRELSYDLDGNMTQGPLRSFGGPLLDSVLEWNGENRMITASNSSMTASYNYDYMGRRFSKIVNETVTTFIYDGWNLIQETTGTNVTQYIWGLDLSGSMQGAGGVGGLICVIENGVKYYPCFDANGNITEYVDTNATIVAHYEYGPFGQIIAQSGDKAADFHFRFSTKYLDAETGLYYYGRRYYSPELSRWVNRDPIGERGGGNIYAFIKNNSVYSVDELGIF